MVSQRLHLNTKIITIIRKNHTGIPRKKLTEAKHISKIMKLLSNQLHVALTIQLLSMQQDHLFYQLWY